MYQSMPLRLSDHNRGLKNLWQALTLCTRHKLSFLHLKVAERLRHRKIQNLPLLPTKHVNINATKSKASSSVPKDISMQVVPKVRHGVTKHLVADFLPLGSFGKG